jgi:hypothetical protein
VNPILGTTKGYRQALIVLVGYAAAFLLSLLAVKAYIALTPQVDRQGAAGMTAFGDSILFAGLLAVASAPVTCLALFYLRPHRRFWQAAVWSAALIAATALLALVGSLPRFHASASGWVMFSPIRVLLAPIFGLAFVLLAIFCPVRPYRFGFLAAVLIEAVVFISVGFLWFSSAR